MTPRARLVAALLVGGFGTGCGLFDPLGTSGTNPPPGGATGFLVPTLEVTVSGTHFGPASPDANAAAALVDTVDSTGKLVQSSFSLSASASSVGASCSFVFERDSIDGIAPIGAMSYLVDGGGTSPTPDGALGVPGSLTMNVPGYSLGCAGTACGGTGVQFLAIDSAHVEGYVSGTFADASGAGSADVVCSFYIPMRTWQP